MIETSNWTVEAMYAIAVEKLDTACDFHESLKNCFNFIGLHGEKRVNEYLMLKDKAHKSEVERLYIDRRYKMIQHTPTKKKEIIPQAMMNITRQAVSVGEKEKLMERWFSEWLDFEKSMCEFYSACIDYCFHNQMSDEELFRKLRMCTLDEIATLEREIERCANVNWCMPDIILWQQMLHDELEEKTKKDFFQVA